MFLCDLSNFEYFGPKKLSLDVYFVIQNRKKLPEATSIDLRIISQIAHFLHSKNKRTIKVSSLKKYD